MKTMNNATPKLSPKSEILTRLDDLDSMIGGLKAEWDALAKHLDPILEARNPLKASEVATNPAKSPIGGRLQTAHDGLQVLAAEIGNLRERICL